MLSIFIERNMALTGQLIGSHFNIAQLFANGRGDFAFAKSLLSHSECMRQTRRVGAESSEKK